MEQAWRVYGDLAVLGLAAGSALTVIVTVVRGFRMRGASDQPFLSALIEALLFSFLVCALALVVVPAGGSSGAEVDLNPADDFAGPRQGLELLAQIVLNLPIAVLLAWRWPRAATLALAMPVALELVQFASRSGRVFSVSDIVIGLVAAAAGIGVVRLALAHTLLPRLGRRSVVDGASQHRGSATDVKGT